MKKHSLLAASVAMALLGAVQQASAANVEVFGFLDQGLTGTKTEIPACRDLLDSPRQMYLTARAM